MLNYEAIRGREQQLIDHFRALGQSANRINGVGPRNPNAALYCRACHFEFGAFFATMNLFKIVYHHEQ